LLTLTHEGFASNSVVHDGISKRWPAILSSLKSLLETGEALKIPICALFIDELDEVFPLMDIKNFKPAIVYTIYIASAPEKLWQALTSAEFSRNIFSAFPSSST
jgi:hypothetical protein